VDGSVGFANCERNFTGIAGSQPELIEQVRERLLEVGPGSPSAFCTDAADVREQQHALGRPHTRRILDDAA
jgi:hypothetical protein